MKTILFATALLAGSAAFAQEEIVTTVETPAGTEVVATTTTLPAVQQPSNANPELDARGIAVISDPAVIPAGFNGAVATAVGGPLVDPVTGAEMAPASYPACTAEITDNCLQTYERGRSPQ
jgi:hypothetical protein